MVAKTVADRYFCIRLIRLNYGSSNSKSVQSQLGEISDGGMERVIGFAHIPLWQL